jgi:hypothetical protein
MVHSLPCSRLQPSARHMALGRPDRRLDNRSAALGMELVLRPSRAFFISPRFHRMHHSTDERMQNRNFGGVFSFWDDVFGTAERRAPPPAQHGLSGIRSRKLSLANSSIRSSKSRETCAAVRVPWTPLTHEHERHLVRLQPESPRTPAGCSTGRSCASIAFCRTKRGCSRSPRSLGFCWMTIGA